VSNYLTVLLWWCDQEAPSFRSEGAGKAENEDEAHTECAAVPPRARGGGPGLPRGSRPHAARLAGARGEPRERPPDGGVDRRARSRAERPEEPLRHRPTSRNPRL